MGPSVAPNASIGIVDERAGGGNSCDDQLNYRLSKEELSIAGTSRSNLQIDLDQWEVCQFYKLGVRDMEINKDLMTVASVLAGSTH